MWVLNKCSDGTYTKSISRIQDVELINIKHFSYLFVGISYNNFTIGDKEIEYRLDSDVLKSKH